MESSVGPSMAFAVNQNGALENADHSGNDDSEVGEREVGLDNIMEHADDEDDIEHSVSQISDSDDNSHMNNSSVSSKFKKPNRLLSECGNNAFSSVVLPSSAAYQTYGNTSHSLLRDGYSNSIEHSNQSGPSQNANDLTHSNGQPSHSSEDQITSKQTLGSVSQYSESLANQYAKYSSQFESSLHSKRNFVSAQQNTTGMDSESKTGIASYNSNPIFSSNSNLEKQFSMLKKNNSFKEQVPSKIPASYSQESENHLPLNDGMQHEIGDGYHELSKKYSDQCKEILDLKKNLEEHKEHSKRDLRILQSQATSFQTENERLKAFIQQKDRALSALTQENTTLKGNLTAVNLEIKAERNAKEEVIKKLECAEVAIKSLDFQLTELARSENRTRYKEQHEKIVNDLKQRHMEEVSNLRSDMEQLKLQLESKISKVNTLQQCLDEAKYECQKLSIEKSKIVHQLNAGIEERQAQSQMDSDAANENSILKQNIRELEGSKRDLERQNCYLKKMGDCVTSEIEGRHSIDSLKIRLQALNEEWRTQKHEEPPAIHRSVENTDAERRRTLQVLTAQKALNERLTNQLKSIKEERDQLLARSKFFEQKLEEENRRYLDSEEKRLQAIPAGTIPVSRHNKEIEALQLAKSEVESQLKDVKIRLREVADNEAYLNELTRQLRTDMTVLIKQHDEDKRNALDVCAKIQAQGKEKLSKAHENEILLLKKTIQQLREGAFPAGNMDKKEISIEIQNQSKDETQVGSKEKLPQLSEHNGSKEELETHLLMALEIEKEKWNIEREQEMTLFIMEMKEKLVAEYDDYLAQERKKILQQAEEEKQQLIQKYDSELKKQKQQKKRLSQNKEMQKVIHTYEMKYKEAKQAALQEMDLAHRKEIEAINQASEVVFKKLKEEFKLKHEEHLKMISQYKDLYDQEVEKHTTKIAELETLSEKFCSMQQKTEAEILKLKEDVGKLTNEKMSLAQKLQNSLDSISGEKQKHEEFEKNLRNALKTANETIAQIQAKREKYSIYSAKLKIEVNEMKEKLNAKVIDLSKKESRYQQLLKKVEELHQREESYKIKLQPKKTSTVLCQTEEAMVPEKVFFSMRDKCRAVISNVAVELCSQKQMSKNRISESLQHCMKAYQDLLHSAVSDRHGAEFDNILCEIEMHVQGLLEAFSVDHQSVDVSSAKVNYPKESECLEQESDSVRMVKNSSGNADTGPQSASTDGKEINCESGPSERKSRVIHTISSRTPLTQNCLSTEPKRLTYNKQSRSSTSKRRSRDFHKKKGIETSKPLTALSSTVSIPAITSRIPEKPRRSRSVETTPCSAQLPSHYVNHDKKHIPKPVKKATTTTSPPKSPTLNLNDTLRSSTTYQAPNVAYGGLAGTLHQLLNELRCTDQLRF